MSLTGWAALPADTFGDGPPSGAWREAGAPGVPSFPSQPVQGVSSLWPAGAGEWWALSDNGYGAKINSSDYLLRLYRLAVSWDRKGGAVTVRSHITIADPDRKLPFPLVRELTAERWLTGADLDPESLVVMPDGTFWIGDEFGPFLIHLDSTGRVLERPFEVPQLRSPDHPQQQGADAGERSTAGARRSRGFEGLAIFGPHLYAAIEAGVGPNADAAMIHEFDLKARAFTGQVWRLPLTSRDHALTEFISLGMLGSECAGRFLAIERDAGHGNAAAIKRVLEVQLAGGAVVSSVVADLLNIANPQQLGGQPSRFRFPFITTEAVWATARHELVLANDNNYPAGGGRPGYDRDPTEFIRLELGTPLCSR